MSNYVLSDIHGNYATYLKMLEKIQFTNQDMLYVLGDILDRGKHPIKIVLDLMNRPNVVTIAGNHEVMAMDCLKFLVNGINEDNISQIDDDTIEKLLNWQQNGSITTTDEFHKLGKRLQKKVIDYISEFDLYEEVQIDKNTFILVHAGLGNFSEDKELWEYELDELVWYRTDYETPYFTDKYVITGHTPTMCIESNPRPGYIYRNQNHIAIDCGCSFPGGRLGCIRLEDMKEFYVEAE